MTTVRVSIRMFGPCLATPSRPPGKEVDRLSVLTPCCPRSRIATDGKTQIDALYTYFVVNINNLNIAESTRQPDLFLKSGQIEVAVFMFHREEITVENDANKGVLFGSDDTTSDDPPLSSPLPQAQDVRWIPHLPTLLPGATVKPACVNDDDPPGVLCTRLVFRSGTFSGRFPCGNPKKRKMKHTSFDNFVAQEMIVSLDTEGTVALQCKPFGRGQKTSRIVLDAPGAIPFQVFFAAGPLINVMELADFNPCVTSNAHTGHAADDADYEFETLWDLFDVPDDAALPVPEINRVHGPRQDCVPGGA